MPSKSVKPLQPLPYGGDRKPHDPTPEQIREACSRLAGTYEGGTSTRGPVRFLGESGAVWDRSVVAIRKLSYGE
jgi:hypothetical protein